MYIWIVATAKKGDWRDDNLKLVSWAKRLTSGWELTSQLEGIDRAHLCKTKKEAYELADKWNKQYMENGTFMYYGEF